MKTLDKLNAKYSFVDWNEAVIYWPIAIVCILVLIFNK